ncbi:cationic amino acid transporter 2-like [Onthophagus taurus]|uniref:cationic amino acid transporter 2-like n=1 Tax=Onthophagus taurus TaxID=166361 RepID=UPI0039BE1AF3
MKENFNKFLRVIFRKKSHSNQESTKLSKMLSTFDLTVLGVGSTLGVGVYVLAGEVAKKYAGPAVVISFLIAAIASIFAGLCFAEVGVRMPRAGSVYEYSYVCMGELIGFLLGWNLILEYIIGSASVVKGLFTYLDALFHHVMSNFFEHHMPINLQSLSKYPDLFSFAITCLFSLSLALGAKESFMANNIFTGLNIIVVLFVIISGLWKVNSDNWEIPQEKVPDVKYGVGGFLPYGISGVLKGAPTCFYGFIGFDSIATAGEEARFPRKSIPIAIIVSLLIIFMAYFGVSTILTMILPYYEQDRFAPLPYIYDKIGWTISKYLVSIGAICGLLSALIGSMFPLPRIIYSMACDGLLFSFLGEVHPKFRTPFTGTLIAGFITGLFATLFELGDLFTLMAIATLVSYSVVAICVIILRYEPTLENNDVISKRKLSCYQICTQVLGIRFQTPNKLTFRIVSFGLCTFLITTFILAVILSKLNHEYFSTPFVISVIILSLIIFISLWIISKQPKGIDPVFGVPLIPWLPGLSIMMNIYLMVLLDISTWLRYFVWMGIGTIIYFSYGIWHSKAISN